MISIIVCGEADFLILEIQWTTCQCNLWFFSNQIQATLLVLLRQSEHQCHPSTTDCFHPLPTLQSSQTNTTTGTVAGGTEDKTQCLPCSLLMSSGWVSFTDLPVRLSRRALTEDLEYKSKAYLGRWRGPRRRRWGRGLAPRSCRRPRAAECSSCLRQGRGRRECSSCRRVWGNGS